MKLNQVLELIVDPYVGISRDMTEVPLQPFEPKLHYCASNWQDTAHISPHSRKNIGLAKVEDHQSAGAGHSRNSAMWSTIGETLERYAASIIDPDRMVLSSYDELEMRAEQPESFILFSDDSYAKEGFPFRRFAKSTVVNWTSVIDYATGQDVYLPAEFVWPGAPTSGFKPLDNGYSTGLAAGQTVSDACFAAVREVAERDAYMCYMQSKISPPRICREDVEKFLSIETAALIQSEDISIHVLDVTTDLGIPCVLTHMIPQYSNSKGIASGLCSHPDPVMALEKSIIECFHTYNWLIDLNRWPSCKISEVQQFMDHVRFYIGEDKIDKLDFLFESPVESDVLQRGSVCEPHFNAVANMIIKSGYNIYLSNITTEDVEALGVSVVRAIIPGLHPIYAGAGFQHTDLRRLKKFLSWKGLTTSGFELNTTLHPFP